MPAQGQQRPEESRRRTSSLAEGLRSNRRFGYSAPRDALTVEMKDRFNRRDVVKAVVAAGAMAMIKPASPEGRDLPLSVASTPVELNLTAISAHTVRVTMLPVRDGMAQPVQSDGAL